MIGIAVACLMFTTVLISVLHWKHVKLGSWVWPLRVAIAFSFGWVIYLALTTRIFH
jgi:hypothetical protein